MKPSTLILAVMSAALLASCQDKSKTEVLPKQPTTQSDGHPNPTPDGCPACGMG